MSTCAEATTGAIARRLGAPRHRIDYVIETRGIEPVRRIGITRLFDRYAQTRIESALLEISTRANKAGVSADDNLDGATLGPAA
ncbi:MAG: hypothetical protein V3T84_11380 [Phycisphaerales bacterium]